MKMKNIIAVCILFISFSCFSQTKTGDDIIGKYMTENNEGMVEITKRDSKYYGKLVWNKTADKLDINNPDKTQHTVLIRGKELLKDFDYNGSGTWHNGTIYDPKNGKTYSCKVTRDEKGNLNVRGFIGVSLIGRTSYWIKVK
jgi:uncharacterized protein (DUF2147 family)